MTTQTQAITTGEYLRTRAPLTCALLTSLLFLAACGGGEKKTANDDDIGTGPRAPTPDDPPSVVIGGLLWDNHWAVNATESLTTNPAWVLRKADPLSGAQNNRTGNDTWRCKECHGWDYKGVEGAYGPGNSHYTGTKGLVDVIPQRSRQQIESYLKNGVFDPTVGAVVHNFGTGEPNLSDNQIRSLVMFLFDGGMIDTSQYIFEDTFNGAARGDATLGQSLYESGNGVNSCASSSCHGLDGRTILFDGTETLGSLAKDNPWEVLHKARFGQPGTPEMIAVRTWGGTDQDASNILAYIQTMLQ